MWFSQNEDEARRLDAEGHERLAAGDLDGARAIADRLLAIGWSGGFELRALVLQREGRVEEAVRALEEGVEKVPGGWVLWQLLGNLRSDLGRLDDALQALDRALLCEGCHESAVRFNRAVVQHRRSEPGAALDDLEPILALPRPPAFAEDALSLAAACLVDLGRRDEAVGLIEAALEACDAEDVRRPRLHAEHATVLERAGADAARVREAFELACAGGIATANLLALGRRLEPVSLTDPQRYRVVVEAASHRGGTSQGFFRVFEVVAGSPDQAFSMARRYLHTEARDAARVEACEVLGSADGAEAGVHAGSARIHFEG